MSEPRVVLITRRFWPLVGGAETIMGRLAAELHRRGLAATLLTAHWQRDWPREIEHHGVRVIRLANPSRRFWGTARYMRAVAGWLRSHREAFDLVYVSMLKHDAYAAVGEGRRGRFPVVLRAEGAGLSGDCHWQLDARYGLRIKRRCLQADAFVAPSPAIERELIAAGYPRPRIHYLPNGVAIPPPRTAEARLEARAALAEIDPALWLDADAPLAVYTGRLHDMKGLEHLVAAWPEVLRRRPQARLWLVGEGAFRERLTALIGNLGLNGRVLLTGAFDDVEDFLVAADLFVLPSLEEGMSLALLEAMARGLPVVATKIPANEVLVEDGRHGRLVPTRDPAGLAAAVLEICDQPEQAAGWGERARRRVSEAFSLDKMTSDHVTLFQRLLSSAR
ncbi:MAG TPA: glycosyltransferase family 4 protein [Pirellulales bacterium]|nr:glycosyltransferase family 4 protein [Pirellulales bacterium]